MIILSKRVLSDVKYAYAMKTWNKITSQNLALVISEKYTSEIQNWVVNSHIFNHIEVLSSKDKADLFAKKYLLKNPPLVDCLNFHLELT